MNRSQKYICAALGLVLMIALGARALGGQSLFSESFKASILSAEPGPTSLTLIDEAPLPLKIGSTVEVHRFSLNAGFPYTLRYLTFEVDMQDLSVPQVSDWSVYEVDRGEIQYENKVGQGESFDDGLLKLRFYSDRSRGYFGEDKQDFALVTTLKRIGENAALSLKQANNEILPDFYKWAWVEGHEEKPWSELIFSQ